MTPTLRIGMVIDPVGSYGRGIIRGVMTYVRQQPSWVITIEPRWAFDRPLIVEHWDVDGMIVQVHSLPFEQEILDRKILATNVSNFISPNRLPTAVPDDPAIGRLAADYFRSRGITHFAFFGGSSMEFSRLRRQAFEKQLADFGTATTFHAYDSYDVDITDWARKLPKPVGVLGCNDDAAHHLLNVCYRAGIKVPDEVAVLGVDDDELLNSLVTPSLSSIRLPTERIGYQAASMLHQLLSGEKLKPNSRVLIPPLDVVTRQSTDLIAVSDPEVAAAVRFIRENAAKPLSVADVANCVAISRRSLERRFKTTIGRGVLSEIQRSHIERAKRLLVETDFAIPKVAKDSGISTATRLGIVFRQAEGITPSEYRRQFRNNRPVS